MKNLLTIAALAVLASANAQIGIGTTSPNSTLDVRGSLALNFRSFSSTANAGSTDNMLVFTGTSAATLTLPDATTCVGRVYRIKNASSNTSTLTIATTASQTIDGLSSWTLSQSNLAIMLISNGSDWYALSESKPGSGTSWINGGNSVTAAQNFGTTSNYDLPFVTNNTERMRLTTSGSLGLGTSTFNSTNPERLIVDAGTDGSGNYQNVIVGKGNTNSYSQLNIQNNSSGNSASADVVATANNGSETVNYIDMGVNGGSNTSTGILGGANTAYLYSTGNDFSLGNATSGKNLLFFTGGTASNNERIRITSSGLVGIGNITPSSTLEVNGSVGHPITTTTSNITLDATNSTVILTSGTPAVTLPAASSCARRIYIIVNQTNAARTVSNYIKFDGNTGTSVPSKGSIMIQSDGSSWYQLF